MSDRAEYLLEKMFRSVAHQGPGSVRRLSVQYADLLEDYANRRALEELEMLREKIARMGTLSTPAALLEEPFDQAINRLKDGITSN